ncbi:hypothetical protein [Pelagibacterium limicola]|uniref:glycine-rich domain-containing protein n=1 Tax=Pelagibacterium limicola TaxID=2791022 RepID=UPI0018AF69FD|nr:hypothetical protein [Pelagibacterium limicola]
MTIIYSATADVENGSTTVEINTGGPLSSAIAAPGFLVAIDGIVYFLESLTDTSTFELTREYGGATDADVPLEIWPINQATSDAAEVFRVVREQRDRINAYDRNAQGLFFNAIGVTGAADPGPGNIAFDDADPTAATHAYIDYLDANSNHRNVAPLLSRLNPGDSIRLRSLATTAFYEFQLTSVVDASGYYSLGVSHIASDGVIGTEPVALSWTLSGNGLNYDAAGSFAGRDDYDDEWLNDEGKPFAYLSSDGTSTVLFVKASAASGDWSPGFPLTGPQGARGWSPVLSIVDRNAGAEAVVRLISWVGGEGTAPTEGVGQYIMPGGFTSNINLAYNIKGVKGDPQGVRLTMNTGTGTGALSDGQFRVNNSSFASVTLVRFNPNALDMGGASIVAWLNALDDIDNRNSRGTLRFQSATDAAVYMEFAVTGDLTVGANGNYEIPVSPIVGARPSTTTVMVASFAPSGEDGEDGEDGADGTDPGLLYEFDDGTADSDPGAGLFRADNTNLSAAEFLFVSKTTRGGNNVGAYLLTLGASTNPVKGHIILTRTDDEAQAVLRISGVTDATGYVKIAVEDHAGATAFDDADTISIQPILIGNQGAVDAVSLASTINGVAIKSAPVAADKIIITDSEDGDAAKSASLGSLIGLFGGGAITIETKTANYTVVEDDRGKTIRFNTSAANRTATLPSAATVGAGWWVILTRADAGSANRLRISTVSSQTINGRAAPLDYYIPHVAIKLVSDGANWFLDFGTTVSVKKTVRTTSGTHNFDANCIAAEIYICGGGAGGRTTGAGSGNGQVSVGSGGGSGGEFMAFMPFRPANSATIAIGSGGAPNATGSSSSYDDGTRSVTCPGGNTGNLTNGAAGLPTVNGASPVTNTQSGWAASGATILFSAAQGSSQSQGIGSNQFSTNAAVGFASDGGSTLHGRGGPGAKQGSTSNASADGQAGSGNGAGGGGAVSTGTNTATGGAGTAGICIITEWIAA